MWIPFRGELPEPFFVLLQVIQLFSLVAFRIFLCDFEILSFTMVRCVFYFLQDLVCPFHLRLHVSLQIENLNHFLFNYCIFPFSLFFILETSITYILDLIFLSCMSLIISFIFSIFLSCSVGFLDLSPNSILHFWLYSIPPLSVGHMFQDPPWVLETMDM